MLSGRDIAFYIVGVDDADITMVKYAHVVLNDKPLNFSQAEFAQIANNVYVTDGANFYRVTLDSTKSD